MLSNTAHPGMSFTQCQHGQQKATSDKTDIITTSRSQADVPSLRQPVVLHKRFTAQSETDSDISYVEESESDRGVSRWSTSRARSSASTPDMSLQTIARAALPGNPENTGRLAETERLHSEDSSSDDDTWLPKRRKVTAPAEDDRNHNSFDELRQHALSVYTSESPSIANLDIS
jgi:hypothetical protein